MSKLAAEPTEARAWLAAELQGRLFPGVTQKDLAQRAGMSTQMLSDYMRGARPISLQKARAIVARVDAPPLTVADLVQAAHDDILARLQQLRTEVETTAMRAAAVADAAATMPAARRRAK